MTLSVGRLRKDVDGMSSPVWHSARLNAVHCTWLITTSCNNVGLGEEQYQGVLVVAGCTGASCVAKKANDF